MDRDRNLLFGIMAVQLRMVSPAQLVEVAGAWAADPSRSLARRMAEGGLLSEQDCATLEGLVEQAVRRHGGDASGALTAFGGDESVHEAFSGAIEITGDGAINVHEVSTHRRPPSEFSAPDRIGVNESPGRYAFVREHGRGGMGRILHVTDQYLGRDIALKELLPRATSDANDAGLPRPGAATLARFLQEARVTGQLEHPSIVPVYELGRRDDGTPYYTMKLVRGRTLAECLEKAKSFRARLEYLPHFANLCHAIAYAHSRGIIHRDIKPGNVMIGEFGETVVIDWGLAKVAGQYDLHAETLDQTLAELSDPPSSATNTLLGQILGTPSYMPPEQARGDVTRIDERSDVYSLGAVLYTMLTGKPPFTGASAREIMDKVKSELPPNVQTCEPHAPRELIAICEHAMQKRPEDRYQSARELVEDIQRFQSGALVEAYQYNFVEHMRRFIARHGVVFGTGAVAAAILATLGLFYHLQLREKNFELQASNLREQQQKQLAEGQSRIARRENYFASIALAKKNVDELRFDRARELLEACPEEYRNLEWGFIRHLREQELSTITGHTGGGTCLAFSADGEIIASGDAEGTVRVYLMANGALLQSLSTRAIPVRSVAFSPDGTRLAVAGAGNDVVLWNWRENTVALRLSGHTRPVNAVAFSRDGSVLASGGSDNSVRVWSALKGGELFALNRHLNDVTAIAFSKDGTLLVSGSRDNTAIVWSLERRESLTEFTGHANDVTTVAFSPDGKTVASGSLDHSICVWGVGAPGDFARLPAGAGVNAIAFSPDGRFIADAMASGSASIWDYRSEERVTSCLGHSRPVNAVVFHPKEPLIVTASNDETVKFWDTINDSRYARMRVALDGPSFARFAVNAECNRLVAAGNYGAAILWDIDTDTPIGNVSCETVDAMELSGNGKRLLTLRSNGTISVIDLETGGTLYTGRDANLLSAALNDDGRTLAVGRMNGTITLIRVDDQEAFQEIATGMGAITAMAFNPNQLCMAAGTMGGDIAVFDMTNGTQMAQTKLDRTVVALQFDAAGTRLAAGGPASVIWNWSRAEPPVALAQASGTILSLVFTRDGERLITGSSNGAITVWETGSGREVLTLERELERIESLALSTDGRSLVAVGEAFRAGDTVLQWRLPSWRGADTRDRTADTWVLASRAPAGERLKHAIEEQARMYTLARQQSAPDAGAAGPITVYLEPARYLTALRQVANVLKNNRDDYEYQGRNFVSEGMIVDGRRNLDLLAQLGVKQGDIITSIEGVSLLSYDHAIESLESAYRAKKTRVSVGLLRNGELLELALSVSPETAKLD